jgi:predicted dehydrogenase
MRRRARLAVAGLGRIGLLHAGNLLERVPSADLVRVADADPSRAQRAGEALAVPWVTDIDELLADGAIEGVVIATPSGMHAEMIEAAARAGRHVLVEKPLAFDVGSAHRALAAARAASVHLQVGFQRRFDPDWRAARERLGQGAIGAPRLLRIAHRNMAVSPDVALEGLGDILIDVVVHDFDTARWLLGEPEQVIAVASTHAPDENATVTRSETVAVLIRFRAGALAMLDTTRSSGYGYECSGELLGSDGALRIALDHRPLGLEQLAAGEARAALATDHESRHRSAYVAELEHFARVVLGEFEPEASGEDGVAALELVGAARESLERSEPVPVPPAPPATASARRAAS